MFSSGRKIIIAFIKHQVSRNFVSDKMLNLVANVGIIEFWEVGKNEKKKVKKNKKKTLKVKICKKDAWNTK